MAQTDDYGTMGTSKVSYPNLAGNISGSVSNSGITAAPTAPTQPVASTMSGSIPSAIRPPVPAPASGGSGSGGGTGGMQDDASGSPLTVNLQRPRLAANTGTASDAPPVNAGTEVPGIQPPIGVRAAQGLRKGLSPVMDALGATDEAAGIPGKIIAAGANQVGKFASDFGGEYFGGGNPSASVGKPLPFDSKFNTQLSAQDERAFAAWKAKNAPSDSGDDYDLRGAFKSGLTPDATTGHWPDTFKKPNHPTFSDQSQYAQYGSPGRWNGDTFVPAIKPPQTANMQTQGAAITAPDANAPGAISENSSKVQVPTLLGGDGLTKPLARASTASFTTPALMTPPAPQSNGPLPTLKAEQGQNVFDAVMNLGKDISAYRGNAAGNTQAQQSFKNLLEASKFNIDNLSKMTKVNSDISEDQRKDFEQQLKSRTAEAVRQLALGPKSASNAGGYDPAQREGLRILAGIDKAPDQWKFHEVLLPKVPGHEMEPQEKASVLENVKTGQLVPFDVGGARKTEAPASAVDYLKKNPAAKEAFKQKYGYLPPGM